MKHTTHTSEPNLIDAVHSDDHNRRGGAHPDRHSTRPSTWSWPISLALTVSSGKRWLSDLSSKLPPRRRNGRFLAERPVWQEQVADIGATLLNAGRHIGLDEVFIIHPGAQVQSPALCK